MNPLYKYLLTLWLSLNLLDASFLDTHYLSKAYDSYAKRDYNSSLSYLKQIETSSLQSQMALGDVYYRQGAYQKAIERYKSIHSSSAKIKQQLYYNIANAYVKLLDYDHAKSYYVKALELGEDSDALYNLKIVALKEAKKEAEVGIAHPKSQNSGASKHDKESKKESKSDEDKPSSGSSGEGKSSQEKNKKKEKLMSSHKKEKHPLGSKVYELINEGYIYEKKPW